MPGEHVNLTPAVVYFIGHAFATWLSSRGHSSPKVSVGRDPRISGPVLEGAFATGLTHAGGTVHTFGLCTTPAMFDSILTSDAGYCGAVMITASHMPWHNNGLKFFTAEGGLEKADISEILQLATGAAYESGLCLGDSSSELNFIINHALQMDPTRVSKVDYLPVYAAHLREIIKRGVSCRDHYHFPLLGLKVVVDAGNGSGGFYATQVLAPLGADISGSQFLDPDGSFPNHIPNPEHPSAMAAGVAAVMAAKADLGIVFDTDVDRSAIVDASGEPINSNRFIALMAAVVLREHPGTTVVTDSVTSNGLTDFITRLGGRHFRFKRGYKNVIGKGVELNRQGVACELMMETSGHGALKENHFLDDGAYMATKAVIELVRRRQSGQGDLGVLLEQLQEPVEAQELRIKIMEQDFKTIGVQVLDQFHSWVLGGAGGMMPQWRLEKENHEGWRISVDEGSGRQGWLLLRLSLHDPLLVLNAESDTPGGTTVMLNRMKDFFDRYCSALPLDLSVLARQCQM